MCNKNFVLKMQKKCVNKFRVKKCKKCRDTFVLKIIPLFSGTEFPKRVLQKILPQADYVTMSPIQTSKQFYKRPLLNKVQKVRLKIIPRSICRPVALQRNLGILPIQIFSNHCQNFPLSMRQILPQSMRTHVILRNRTLCQFNTGKKSFNTEKIVFFNTNACFYFLFFSFGQLLLLLLFCC